jgi:gliding motility-associated-like protein
MVAGKKLIVFIVLSVIHSNGLLYSQGAYINTQQGIFQLTGGPGNSSRVAIDNGCGVDNNILSLAMYKDTVYYNTWSGELKRFKMGVPGSCETLIDGGNSYNAMTIDKNGILYMATEELVRYDPYSKQLTNLGRMPFFSGGDMLFFNNKLLLAGYDPYDWSSGIFEIDINNFNNSKLYMSTPAYIGLLSYPVPCGKSRHFGLTSNNTGTTQFTELDLANKLIVGESCSMPLDILDAGSSTETGLDDAVRFNSVQITKLRQASTGYVQVAAFYTIPGTITYTLDNSITNTTGTFTNISVGQHHITAKAPGGLCSADTVIIVSNIAEATPAGYPDIFIPTAFSPNGDGKNDFFNFSFPADIKDMSLSIFNRTGNKVYEGRGNTISWDGNYNGVRQPVSVYVYTINYTDRNGNRKNLKGTLTLIR